MTEQTDSGARGYRLAAIERLGREVRGLRLECVDAEPLRFRGGQFVSVTAPGGLTRSYSMAAAPRADGGVELQVRLQPGGAFSEWLSRQARPGDALWLEGPYGDCVWREDSGAEQALMLATGTGIAPLRAMLLQGLGAAGGRPVTLYWGGRTVDDLYLLEEMRAWERERPGFRFEPVLSEPGPGWDGRRGFVQQAAAEDFPCLRAAEVYACGAPAMVGAARQLLTRQRGLPEERFLADAFQPALSAASALEAVALSVRVADGGERRLEVAAAGSLMQALAAAGLMRGVCGGQAACGTCLVRVGQDWLPRLPAMERTERRLLAALEVLEVNDGRSRLACQIALQPRLHGLSVVVPG
ncbi:FAD-binding oxidoreductase [Chromobacterium sp. LK11]|uniref:FAD-binding oxidoreductase n=1 Tax=Chromobacterium sp. LK11 TaxID=1628212 RepID=UPI00069FBBCF|nr:FAD-binding oxidoreductase [Chromobacterium sp. LK11]